MTKKTTKEFFMKRIRKNKNECWIFMGTINKNTGYGMMGFEGKPWVASRLSYKLNIGDIPKGLLVCHKCDNRRCINPDHLFLGTHKDNIQDMLKKGRHVKAYCANGIKKKACIRGHEYSEKNTWIDKKTGFRHCRVCHRNRYHTNKKLNAIKILSK